MSGRDLTELSAAALTEAYSRSELSPVEVARAVLERIEAFEPHVNALFKLRGENAVSGQSVLAEASASEVRWRAGTPLSQLDGVPITIKENVATRGHPLPYGSPTANLEELEIDDFPPAARAKEAGCVVVGKTTMPDFGMLMSGLSGLHGTTRNPWDVRLNAAGSSGGAAAAVAAGYGPLAIGTDIAGSNRVPASFCGVTGYKPSWTMARIRSASSHRGRRAVA